jgi:hypothetical protein
MITTLPELEGGFMPWLAGRDRLRDREPWWTRRVGPDELSRPATCPDGDRRDGVDPHRSFFWGGRSMTRWSLVVVLALFAASGEVWAGVFVDTNRYPAKFELKIQPDLEIENGANFFSQTGAPNVFNGLNLIMTSYPFKIEAGQVADVGPTFGGNPFGVYKSYTNQYQSFLATYGDRPGLYPTGLVALLAKGVGQGKTFNEVFGPQYGEDQVIKALADLKFGNTTGFLLLYDMMSNNLAKQPTYLPSGPNSFTLGDAELIKFSTGESAGVVLSGAYKITEGGSSAVPEPASWLIAAFGGAISVVAAHRKRRQDRRRSLSVSVHS